MPAVLAVLVGAGHWVVPEWAALAVISLAALVVVCVVVLVQQGARAGGHALYGHVRDRLPGMSGELVLFLSAAVFASGLRALMDSGGLWLPFAAFGVTEAALVLAAMILLAALGIHAVITIAMASAWLAPLQPEPTLLALVFVQSWAIGLAAGPMSGIHLALQGRYGLSAAQLARTNVRYCVQAYAAAVVWLAAVGSVLGVPLLPAWG